MPFIIIMTIIIYVVLIIWMWKSLGNIEKKKKIMIISIGILAIYILTLIIFQISKQGLNYENEMIGKTIGDFLKIFFSGLNGLVLLPFICKTIEDIEEDEIDKNKFQKRIFIILIIIIVLIIFECGYMKNTQEGILQIYKAMK